MKKTTLLLGAMLATSLSLNAMDFTMSAGIADPLPEKSHFGVGIQLGDFYKTSENSNFHNGWAIGISTLAGTGETLNKNNGDFLDFLKKPFFLGYVDYRPMLRLTPTIQAYGLAGIVYNNMQSGYTATGYELGGGLRKFVTETSYIGTEYKSAMLSTDIPKDNINNWPSRFQLISYSIFYGFRF